MGRDTEIRFEDGHHVVHFYDEDDDVVRLVVDVLAPVLLDDGCAIVIATPEHCAAFHRGFAGRGVDVDAATARGALVTLDAESTLAQLMVGDRPDAAAFRSVVGALVENAARGGRRVCAFGEMVSVLWHEGNIVAAGELEALWEALFEDVPFALLCAYPSWLFHTTDGARRFADVCRQHNVVHGAAPLSADAETSVRFAASSHSAKLARDFVVDVLHSWKRPELAADAALLVSELATNALRHACSDFTVSLTRDGDVVRIAVGDTSGDAPRVLHVDERAAGGRGLRLVDAISQRWGHHRSDRGKLVWIELGAPEPVGSRHH